MSMILDPLKLLLTKPQEAVALMRTYQLNTMNAIAFFVIVTVFVSVVFDLQTMMPGYGEFAGESAVNLTYAIATAIGQLLVAAVGYYVLSRLGKPVSAALYFWACGVIACLGAVVLAVMFVILFLGQFTIATTVGLVGMIYVFFVLLRVQSQLFEVSMWKVFLVNLVLNVAVNVLAEFLV